MSLLQHPCERWTSQRCARLGITLLFIIVASLARAEDATTLKEFTGQHTRLVWIQDFSQNSGDILTLGQRLKLMGFDSHDGKGERAILGELRNYSKPLLTPDGQRVVFSDQQSQKFYVVNWDGTGRKLLGEGLAVDVWRDSSTDTEWVYYARRVGKPENVTYRNLRRLKLLDPKTIQKVWDQTDVGCDNFQLAADGIRAGGEFPWPNGGIVDLQSKTWKKLDEGCWASIAPDNSGVSWVFDGPHRNLQFHRPDQTDGWKVNINSAPRIGGAEVFHPRWSNHVRYFAMTGPYSVKGAVNMISGGGPQVEIYLGRFSPDYRSVEAWWPVTANSRGDFYPDAWIADGPQSIVELPGLSVAPPVADSAVWPPATEGLIFAWNHSADTNQIPDTHGKPGRSCQFALQGAAFPGRFHDLSLRGGSVKPLDIEAQLLHAYHTEKAVTLSMLVTVADRKTSAGVICRMGGPSNPMFQLRQTAERLEWRSGSLAFQPVDPPTFQTTAPVHLAVVLSPRTVKLYADAREIVSRNVETGLAEWTSGELTLGDRSWQGQIEAVALHARALSPAEITRQATVARQRIARRQPIARYRVQARCRERSTVPDPVQILPYRRALAVHDLEIVKVLSRSGPPATGSDVEPGARVLVAQWVILDGETLKQAAHPRVDELVELTLEPADGHPELKSERQLQDVDALDLPLFYDVGDFFAL